jgi:RimJ/RimL family protein N-acetyltransferase
MVSRPGTVPLVGSAVVASPDFPIRTARLELRLFQQADLPALTAMRSRDDVARHLLRPALTPEESRAELEQAMAVCTLEHEGDALDLAVVRRDTGAFIGDVVLFFRSAEHGLGEIGFVFHPDHHGQGFAREAATAMLGVGFDIFGFHRIIGRCDADNAASAGLMERLGMRREAHFVRNARVKGRWADELVYAVLDDEWAALPAASPRRPSA